MNSELIRDLICEIYGFENTIWQICQVASEPRICKIDSAGNTIFLSSDTVEINSAAFDIGFSNSGLATRRNVIFTVVGSHENEDLKVSNVVRQTVISTRNYVLF